MTLKTEQNSRSTEKLVRSAAAQRFGRGKARPVFEHGQWWALIDDPEADGFRTFSVVDSSPGIGDTGLEFEEC